VDDEEISRELFGYMLKTRNYNILEAGFGTEALSVLEKAQPDLILLDLFMDDGDGFMVTRAVRENPKIKAIPILVITAADSVDIHRKIQEAGCDGLILKPIDMERFLDTVDQFLT
jgi:two-component system cell cycle response regulator DivK